MLSFFFFLLNYEISLLSYVDLESTDIDLEKECKFLGTKSKKKRKNVFFFSTFKETKRRQITKFNRRI